MSTAFPPTLETVQITVKENYVVITLNRPPVNGMNLTVWTDLLTALDACEKNKAIRGAIFTSGLERDIFTAGNDLKELHSKSTTAERFMRFWTAQTTFLTRLYASRLATVAAIRGACPAGGCILAMCCDYRVMTDNVPGAVIGLNEVAIGLSVPRYWCALYERLVGAARAEAIALTGKMLTPKEAAEAGLVSALANKDTLMPTAEAAMAQYLRLPDVGRVLTKQSLRLPLAKPWQAYCEEEAKMSWQVLDSPAAAQALGQVMAKLAGGEKKPKSKL